MKVFESKVENKAGFCSVGNSDGKLIIVSPKVLESDETGVDDW